MAFDLEGAFEFNAGDRMAELAATVDREFDRRIVNIDLLDDRPDNRAIQDSIVDLLADDFLKNGMGQDPLVRETGDGRYQIIAGHHRVRAYRKNRDRNADGNWDKISVLVKKDCSDQLAERLMWATNINSATLTREERDKGCAVLYDVVKEERAAEPEKFKGKRTTEVVAEMAGVSDRTVKRAIAKRKDTREKKVVPKKPADPYVSMFRALDKAVSVLEDNAGSIPDSYREESQKLTSRLKQFNKSFSAKKEAD